MLEADADDRDPFFVAVQVHTWMHGIVDLLSSHKEGPWPDLEELLDGLCSALGLEPR